MKKKELLERIECLETKHHYLINKNDKLEDLIAYLDFKLSRIVDYFDATRHPHIDQINKTIKDT